MGSMGGSNTGGVGRVGQWGEFDAMGCECGYEVEVERLRGERLPGLARLTTRELRAAAASFAASTSTSYDGFHPRIFGVLSEDGLRVLAAILEAAECIWGDA